VSPFALGAVWNGKSDSKAVPTCLRPKIIRKFNALEILCAAGSLAEQRNAQELCKRKDG
jgi:hypothetical protein